MAETVKKHFIYAINNQNISVNVVHIVHLVSLPIGKLTKNWHIDISLIKH